MPLTCVDLRIHYYSMEPEYVPSEFLDPWRPGAVYCEASMRPSCRRLADATHGDSSEMNPRRAGDGQDQPDTPGTFLDSINRYQRVVAEKPPHAETDSRRPKEMRWHRPYLDESHQHNLEC